ncbi:MAG: transposase [Ilumatobacteraceae bacterium]
MPHISDAESTSPGNLLALVPKSHQDMVAAVFRTIFAQPDADATWEQVAEQLAAWFPNIGPLMDAAKIEVLALTGLPRAHWQNACSIASGRSGLRRGGWGLGDDSIGICLRGFSISVSPR